MRTRKCGKVCVRRNLNSRCVSSVNGGIKGIKGEMNWREGGEKFQYEGKPYRYPNLNSIISCELSGRRLTKMTAGDDVYKINQMICRNEMIVFFRFTSRPVFLESRSRVQSTQDYANTGVGILSVFHACADVASELVRFLHQSVFLIASLFCIPFNTMRSQ